ncbi:MAG: hypothetical protein ACPGUC_11260 [Gammaproteobacteria bacterium]
MKDEPHDQAVEGAFQAHEECLEHALQLICGARRELIIQAPTLDARLFSDGRLVEAIKHLALNARASSIRMLIQNDTRLAGHRALPLIQRLSSRFTLNRQDRGVEFQPGVIWIADGRHYLYRKEERRFEGLSDLSHPQRARRLRDGFEELWSQSHPDPESRRLMI